MSATLSNLRAIIKHVTIEGEEFYGVRFNVNDTPENLKEHGFSPIMYGTLSYRLVDENGRTRRNISLFDLCEADTLSEAIARRRQGLKDLKILEAISDMFKK